MFTGLIETTGSVQRVTATGDGRELGVDLGPLAERARIGDSIALSGVCCTITALVGQGATFHLTRETLERTWLGQAAVGQLVNLEAALRAGDPLGGHLVQGHVDGVGEVVAGVDPRGGGTLRVRIPDELTVYCAVKGSVTIDGVSLTIADLVGSEIAIAVIPHTAAVTTIGEMAPGQPVNVEVDVLAKYVERLLEARFRA